MGKARDIQGVIRTIPVPTTLSPAPDETVTSKTPIFSWQAVEYPDTPLYYRLQIKDDADDLVLSTDREHGMLSCTAPVLNPGQTYYWRVRVSDSDDFVKVQNRSQTDWEPPPVHAAAQARPRESRTMVVMPTGTVAPAARSSSSRTRPPMTKFAR